MDIICPNPNCRTSLEGDSSILTRETICPSCQQPFFADPAAPLRRSAATASRGIYLQLISVIQSMALGLWVYSLDLARLGEVAYLFQSLLILQFIVITWHEYVIGTVIYEWPVGLLDAWIPICLGIAQFYLIRAPNYTHFSWALVAMALTAVAAFWNQYVKSKNYEGNQGVIEILATHRKASIGQTIAFGFIFIFAAWFSNRYSSQADIKSFILLILNLTLLGHQIRVWMGTRKLFYSNKMG